MNKKQIAMVLAITLVGFTAPLCQAADDGAVKLDGKSVTFSHYAKAFMGQGNVKVEMAPYKTASGEGALLVFHGMEGDWDGKAVNHVFKDLGYESSEYTTRYKSKDWRTLQISTSDKGKKYLLYPPGTKDEIELTPSDGAAQMTTPQAIYEEYLQQKKSH